MRTRQIHRAAIAAFCLTLAACGTNWKVEGGTDAQRERDKTDCRDQVNNSGLADNKSAFGLCMQVKGYAVEKKTAYSLF